MSYGYQEYGGNPYGQPTAGSESDYSQSTTPYAQQSNPYGTSATTQQGYGSSGQQAYGTQNPYGTSQVTHAGQASYGAPQQYSGYSSSARPAAPAQQESDYSTAQTLGGAGNAYSGTTAAGGYGQMGEPGVVKVPAPPQTLSNQDFLSRVEAIRGQIRELTSNVGEIGSVHQRLIASPDANHSQLDNLVSRTQILNTQIQGQIRQLEADSLKSGDNTTKKSQIRTLKGHFRQQLEDYQKEEAAYKKRYREQIAREYRIVNPEASDAEVREAAEANWGDEGVFQTALKSNRTGAASSVLGNVRARHNDIQRIEQTLIELNQMFMDLAAQVELQEPQVQQVEEQTQDVTKNTEEGNKQLDSGIKHAKTRRKLKWWCFGIVVLIVIILAAVLGGYFGTQANKNKRRRRDIEAASFEEALVQRMIEQAFEA